jgi:hypothetical protein
MELWESSLERKMAKIRFVAVPKTIRKTSSDLAPIMAGTSLLEVMNSVLNSAM